MRKSLLILAGLTLLNSSSALAKEGNDSSQKSCLYTKSGLVDAESSRTVLDFIENDKYADDWACVQTNSHISGDTLKNCSPDSDIVDRFTSVSSTKISGKMDYRLSLMTALRPYSYEISPSENGGTNVTVKIHFTGKRIADPVLAGVVKKTLDDAAVLWTTQSPNKSIKFNFQIVGANESPDFKIEIKNANGNLYDTYWDADLFNKNFASATIAHELGHMMGISDEYDPVRQSVWQVKSDMDTRRCNTRGAMCNPYKPKMYPYYYYLILRRAVCVGKNI